MLAGTRMPSGGTPPGRAPPPPGSLPPVPGSGTPSPRPVRDMPYTPFFLRGPASLSRSKPVAVSLVPRTPLWVSSARSSACPLRPFLCSSLRSLLSPRLSRYARPRYAVFYHTGLTSRRINHTMLSRSQTIFVTSRKWPLTLILYVNHE